MSEAAAPLVNKSLLWHCRDRQQEIHDDPG